jgi:uncharacterized protein (DUF58 family)
MARRRLTLTTRGMAALGLIPVSALAGALLGAEELVLLAFALCALLLSGLVQSAYRASVARTNWRVGVELPTTEAAVGGHLEMSVTLAAAGRGGATPVRLEDPEHCWERVSRAGPPKSERARRPSPSRVVRVPQVDSGATAQFGVSVPTERRGVFALAGLRLWCFDSFGLIAQRVALGPRATIVVHPVPAPVELRDEVLRGDGGTEDNPQQPVSSVPRRDSFGDFSGIRDYVPGDRLRLLWWPALARNGDLMVRDFEDSGPHRVHVVADIRALIGESGCESVLATAAGVGLEVLAQGSMVELSTTTGERIAIGPGPLGAQALLRAIAGVETPVDAAPRARVAGWRGRVHRRASASPVASEREFHLIAGTPVMVTTAVGVQELPGSLGFAQVVLAP